MDTQFILIISIQSIDSGYRVMTDDTHKDSPYDDFIERPVFIQSCARDRYYIYVEGGHILGYHLETNARFTGIRSERPGPGVKIVAHCKTGSPIQHVLFEPKLMFPRRTGKTEGAALMFALMLISTKKQPDVD